MRAASIHVLLYLGVRSRLLLEIFVDGEGEDSEWFSFELRAQS